MKRFLLPLIIAAFSAFLALFHASCALTPEQMQAVQLNALKDARAAGIGYLQGGKSGAIHGLTAQILMNHAPLTSAKNPRKVTK
jgi:hypothetical protein